MDFLGLLGSIGDAIDAQLSAVVVWATAQMSILYGDISNVNAALGDAETQQQGLWASLWSWLTNLWDWLNRAIIQRLRDLLQRIHDRLKSILGPLLDWLKMIRDRYRDLWLTYVKPVYDFLQRLRRVLVLFRLLGFKWAQKLDARIQAIETALTNSFLAVFTNLNRLADWINFILDPFGLFQPSVWLRSIAQSVGAIIGIVYGTMNDPGYAPASAQYVTPGGYYQRDNVLARFRQSSTAGILPEDADCIQSLRQSAASLGYTY